MHEQHSGFAPTVNRTASPPHNDDVERALLGAILLDNHLMERVVEFLKPVHFFEPLHGEIYNTAETLIRQGKTASPITLRTFFENNPPIEVQYGNPLPVPEYLARLVAQSCVPSSVRDYGQTIIELSTRRQLILIAEDMVAAVYDPHPGIGPGRVAEESMARLFELGDSLYLHNRQRSFGDLVDEALQQANDAYCNGSKLSGLSCGITDLDEKMGGLQPSNLIYIAGRPAAGKTALAVNMAYEVAKTGKAVAIFSMEMAGTELAMRVIAERSGVSSERLRRGTVTANEWPTVVEGSSALKALPLWVDETGGLTISGLTAKARRMHRQHKLELVVVDYIQLMQGSGNRNSNRVNELEDISTGLKALAKELNVPVVALSQLSRGVESRDDKRPQMSDMRGSGGLEQDADIILFVFREEYYLERQEPTDPDDHSEWQAKMAKARGTADVIIGKHRHGPTGSVKLAFAKDLTRFSNLEARQ